MTYINRLVCAGLVVMSVGSLQAASGRTEAGQAGDFGVGAVLGSPTGLSLKYWLSDSRAVDGSLAWNFGHEDRFSIVADHLWHIPLAVPKVPGKLPFYTGVGLRVLAGDDSEAGVRIPLGLAWLVRDIPLEIFAEIAPVVEFAPDTDADVDGGIGVRFYFL